MGKITIASVTYDSQCSYCDQIKSTEPVQKARHIYCQLVYTTQVNSAFRVL